MQGAMISAVSAALDRKASPAPAGEEMDRLLARVASTGDRAAFSRLYGYFAPRLKSYLMKIGCAGDLAEDLAQETLTKVWRKSAQFDPEKASASTWIYTIARNARIDAARRRARGAAPEPDDPALTPPPEPMADEAIERHERDALIRAAFRNLPPNQHKVVIMHFIEDEPHTAIAERLGLPLGTVKSRLRLAFGRIRKDLEGKL